MEKVGNIKEQMGNISKEMKILGKNWKKMLEIIFKITIMEMKNIMIGLSVGLTCWEKNQWA